MYGPIADSKDKTQHKALFDFNPERQINIVKILGVSNLTIA